MLQGKYKQLYNSGFSYSLKLPVFTGGFFIGAGCWMDTGYCLLQLTGQLIFHMILKFTNNKQ